MSHHLELCQGNDLVLGMEMLSALLACFLGISTCDKGPLIRRFNVFFVISIEQDVEQTVKLPVIWDVMACIWYHCNVKVFTQENCISKCHLQNGVHAVLASKC